MKSVLKKSVFRVFSIAAAKVLSGTIYDQFRLNAIQVIAKLKMNIKECKNFNKHRNSPDFGGHKLRYLVGMQIFTRGLDESAARFSMHICTPSP